MLLPSYETLMRTPDLKPRVHPNGFIQIDLTHVDLNREPTGRPCRLHVWPDTPLFRQGGYHPVHDHRFNMKSTILCGKLVNRLYTFIANEDGDYQTFEARYASRYDNTLVPIKRFGFLEHVSSRTLLTGSSYTVQAGQLHSSHSYAYVQAEPQMLLTATFMESFESYPQQAVRVIVPTGTMPDNAFSRHSTPETKLWKIVERAYANIRRRISCSITLYRHHRRAPWQR